MLCISVAPQSRRLAKADLLNASGLGDLVELCLDHLIKEPDVGDMLQGIPKPVLVSCRRPQEGGRFTGTEEERMTLLRQAIVASPAYIELDWDTATKVPRFGKTQRVVSLTSMQGPLDEVDSIFDQAASRNADVLKFAWPTPTFETAWPLMKLIGQRRSIPVVGVGLGAAGTTLALLGRQLGVPWGYAALEHGLETFPGQATVHDLRDIYAWDDIEPSTRFVGIAGLKPAQTSATCIYLNAAFRRAGERFRCLPLPLHSFDNLGDRLDRLKLSVLLFGPDRAAAAAIFADELAGSAKSSGYADIVIRQKDHWTGYNTIWRHALYAMEEKLGKKSDDDRPLDRRNAMIIGDGGLARAFIYGVQRRQGIVSITGPNDKQAQQLAQQFEVRHVPFHALYDTLADVVIVADSALQMGHHKNEINPAYLRSTMTFMDLSAMPDDTPLLEEARARGCRIVEPADVFRGYLAAQFESITGKSVPTADA